ncbi:MAG: hypothetical protein LBW85_09730 [Deltaproteobacteria bacterium]|jgi:hypothetical protein|nr:hypothetical protein [Deltaproteobacteria bacterium]
MSEPAAKFTLVEGTVLFACLALLFARIIVGEWAEPRPESFYMCYQGHEYLVYPDRRTGGQGLAMSFDIRREGYVPRECSGTQEERKNRDEGK